MWVASRVAERLKTRILGNKEISGKCLNSIEWEPSTQFSCQNQNFVNTSKNFLKKRN